MRDFWGRLRSAALTAALDGNRVGGPERPDRAPTPGTAAPERSLSVRRQPRIREHSSLGIVREGSGMPEPAIPVRGLFEAHLTVSDLSRSIAFYQDIVGLRLALEMPERGAAFFWCGSRERAMLGLWSLGSMPMGLNLHLAFDVELEHVLDSPGRLRALGATPLSFFGRETDEPTVIAWMPAAAVYFKDPDGHLLEYLAMLDAEPRADLGIIPWSEWSGGASPRVG
jgi:lactoylglutathione lyase